MRNGKQGHGASGRADGRRRPYKAFCFRCRGNHRAQTLQIDVQIATEVSRGVRSKASSRTEEIRRDILVSRGQVTYGSS